MKLSQNTIPNGHIITRGDGVFIYDNNGNKIFDFCSQTLNLNLGHTNPVINKRINDVIQDKIFLSSRFKNAECDELLNILSEISPVSLNRALFKITCGSLANEAALKMSYKHTNNKGVISFIGSHHGQSFETMRVSGKNFDKKYIQRDNVFFIEPPLKILPEDVLKNIKTVLEKNYNDISCIILEPIMVDAGVIIFPKELIREIRNLCNRYNKIFIFDEIQTAFGWTGNMFYSEQLETCPDVLTACKGFAAGLPLGLVLFNDKLDNLSYGEHEITHGASPLCCAVASTSINFIRDNNLLLNVKKLEVNINKQFSELQEKYKKLIKAIRGKGVIWGIEINDSHIAKKIFSECLNNGLLLRLSEVGGNSSVIQFKPPIITTENEINEGISILDKCLKNNYNERI